MTKKILVLGALSEIAEATCRLYAPEGAQFFLAARSADGLEALAADLKLRGATAVHRTPVDLVDADPEASLREWTAALGGLDLVLLAYGMLGDQPSLENDLQAAGRLIDVNFRSAALWSLAAAAVIEKEGRGTLAVIGSVAGDRGRQSNYLYGATKAGLGVLVEGIAHRLAPSGGRAVLIKPGFVDTAMTAHIEKKGALWSPPQKVAALIRRSVDSGRPIVYAPGYWRLIMAVIKAVPSAIFHRTRL
jgi:NAD(P)-dependent dehydrogenase (short-subunit alcohol dehydrogenase family)